jgi:tetraacyldisaccharide 4'-kinase
VPDSPPTVHSGFPGCWSRTTGLTVLLLPLAGVFALLVAVRRLLFRCGALRSHRLPVKVIVVGNLTVGGVGKTPLVLWLAQWLRSAGLRPGILLRGYGGSRRLPHAVSAADDPLLTGDEAVLLAGRAGCPVWAGRDRAATGRALLQAHPECNIILCDDGLQHYRLARDVEIAVEDERGHGNGWMLPAGPLREPASRAVDATVVNGLPIPAGGRPGRRFGMRLVPAGFETLSGHPVEATRFEGLRLHAVAGIGHPARFFATLSGMGLKFTPHAFPDHHAFVPGDLQFLDCDAVLMTEKDAVKCRAFASDGCYMLRVAAEADPAFADYLLEAIHGRQTA